MMESIQQPIEKPKMRELLIKTDGTNVHVEKCEWTNLELASGLSMILNKLNK